MKDENEPLINYSKRFDKQRKNLPPEIKIAFRETLELFLEDPTNPALRDHSLKKEFAGFRSIEVTEDVRAIYRKEQEGKREAITFYLIGTHEELYGKKK